VSVLKELRRKKEELMKIVARHGVTRVQVFGSVARGEEGPDSDIDFLIAVGEKTSPWFPSGLVQDLEELLGRKVEVVTTRGLHPLLRDEVLREATPL